MELYSEDVRQIKAFLEKWALAPEAKPIEVEATFGQKGQVDIQTFLRVVAYLTGVRRLSATEQQDYLTISTDEDIRFTVMGEASVAAYCRENQISDMEGTLVQQKNKTGSLPVDVKEYNVRVKSATEVDLNIQEKFVQSILANWSQRRKYFRLIKRWSFMDDKRGVRFDLSMVRSTMPPKFGEKRAPITSFQDQPILNHAPTYEIEVELKRDKFMDLPQADRVEEGWRALYLSIGDVLKAIQGSPILIRYSLKEEVLREYATLLGSTLETKQFIGVSPVTLRKDNVADPPEPKVPNIRQVVTKKPGSETPDISYYNVTDKADGLRCLGFVRKDGEFFLLDMNFNVYRTGLVNPAVKSSIVDGEFITQTREKKPIVQYAIFDYYIGVGGDTSMRSKPFYVDKSVDTRHQGLIDWITGFNTGLTRNFNSKYQVGVKTFQFASATKSIFTCAGAVLDSERQRDYYQDGLIFTPNAPGIPSERTWFAQFKWKPAQDNTVDFLVKIEKDPDHPSDDLVVSGMRQGEYVDYKVLKLYAGSDAPEDPRALYLSGNDICKTMRAKVYRAIPFTPKDPPDSDASKCLVVLETVGDQTYIATEDSKEPITDNMIVEMKYDLTRPPGWRWVPTRVRQDKTEKFRKALAKRSGNFEKTFNNVKIANDIWASIHDPITSGMIRNAQLKPTVEEAEELEKLQARRDEQGREYYVRKKELTKDVKKSEAMRTFHKKQIKEGILFESIRKAGELAKERPKLIDFASGLGGDYVRYLKANAGFVLGVDVSPNNINNPYSGAYYRLVDDIQRGGCRTMPPPIFYVVGDSTVDLRTGQAGFAEEDKTILQTIFGSSESTGQVPLRVVNQGTRQLKDGADACCLMYALHYFFGEPTKLEGLLQNVQKTLKIGGLFVGTNFDGGEVYNLLRTKGEGEQVIGQDDSERIWELTKQFSRDNPTIPKDYGLQIDVQFASISPEAMAEYLIPWELQVEEFRKVGLELLTEAECKELGLPASTELYKDTLKRHKKLGLNEATRKYSELHRWWVFKRKASEEPMAQAGVPAEEAEEAKSSALTESDVFRIRDPLKTTTENKNPTRSEAVLGVDLKMDYPGRYLAPSAVFDFKDGDEVYPTFWNYWAGMQCKSMPTEELQTKRFNFQKNGQLWTQVEAQFIKDDTDEKRRKTIIANRVGVLKLFTSVMAKVSANQRGAWTVTQAEVCKAGLRQRFFGDARFKAMVCRIVSKGLVVLFDDANLELGGSLTEEGTIAGLNLYGKLLMEIAKEPGMCSA